MENKEETQREVAIENVISVIKRHLYIEIIANKGVLEPQDILTVTAMIACEIIEAYSETYNEDKNELTKIFCEGLTQVIEK